jgi:Amiloride-sensitive sodium channel
MLRSEQGDYLCSTESAGFRLSLHQAGEVPFPDIMGNNVPPGYTTSISMFMVKPQAIIFEAHAKLSVVQNRIKRLSASYGNCVSNNSMLFFYDGKYTVEVLFSTANLLSLLC